MNTAEIIHEKVRHLPPKAQEQVLEAVEQIAERYNLDDSPNDKNGETEFVHPLTLIANLATDTGVTDLADRHDFYAHGKLEE